MQNRTQKEPVAVDKGFQDESHGPDLGTTLSANERFFRFSKEKKAPLAAELERV